MMTHTLQPLRRLAVVLGVALTATACTGGDSEEGSDRGRMAEVLEWIPSAQTTVEQVIIVDLATLRESGGVELPEDPGDWEQVSAYERALAAATRREEFDPQVLDLDTSDERTHENLTTYLGMSFADVDVIAVSGQPPTRFYLVGGRFDADRAYEALIECDGCALPTDEYEHEGVRYLGWGAEQEQHLRLRFAPPLLDFLGRGGRLLMTDDVAIKTHANQLIEASIDAGELDDRESLADLDDFALAVEALERERAYMAMLTRFTLGPRMWAEVGDAMLNFVDHPERYEPLWNPEAGTAVLREYGLFSAGTVTTGDDNYLVVVLVHGDAADAEANVELLRRRIEETESVVSGRPWREEITSFEIEADGRVLIARLHGVGYWTFWNEADPLTLHE